MSRDRTLPRCGGLINHTNIAGYTKERHSLPHNMTTCLALTFSRKTLFTVPATAQGTSGLHLQATQGYSQLAVQGMGGADPTKDVFNHAFLFSPERHQYFDTTVNCRDRRVTDLGSRPLCSSPVRGPQRNYLTLETSLGFLLCTKGMIYVTECRMPGLLLGAQWVPVFTITINTLTGERLRPGREACLPKPSTRTRGRPKKCTFARPRKPETHFKLFLSVAILKRGSPVNWLPVAEHLMSRAGDSRLPEKPDERPPLRTIPQGAWHMCIWGKQTLTHRGPLVYLPFTWSTAEPNISNNSCPADPTLKWKLASQGTSDNVLKPPLLCPRLN